MADLVTFNQYKQLKNYVDDKTDDGYHINGDNLTFRDSNEIIISGLNATKNDSGTVDGVTISSGKVILSPDIFNQQDIKLEKASGIYRGYEIELEAGTELTAPVYTPSVLSADSGTVVYTSHSKTQGYVFNDDNSITFVPEIIQAACTISGLNDSAAEDIIFDYNSVTIPAADSDITITANNAMIQFDGNITAGGSDSTFKGGASTFYVTIASNGNTYILDSDVGNAIFTGYNSDDVFIVNGVRYYPSQEAVL